MTPANQACTRFTYPRRMEGRVYLGSLLYGRNANHSAISVIKSVSKDTNVTHRQCDHCRFVQLLCRPIYSTGRSCRIRLVTTTEMSLLLGFGVISLSWSHGEMWIWWTSVVLLFAATHAVKCPQMCDCQQPSDQQLTVDCRRRKINESILAQELDQQLSDDELKEHLTSLQISNTPLTQIPISVCHLTNLTSLNLNSNRLTRLPDNCFTLMRHLQWLSASENTVTQIQDGLFDGVNTLRGLTLDKNQITNIGLCVFSNLSDLTNLKLISLEYNKLQSLEPWPYIRGLYGSPDSKVSIHLYGNLISNFTNNMDYRPNCSSVSYAKVFLSSNNIRHISDILVGWNQTPSRLSCSFRIFGAHPSFEIDVRSSRNYACDCQDFFIHAFLRRLVHYDILDGLRCNTPSRLGNKLVAYVELNEFECEVSDHCPSSCRCVYRPENATLHVYCSATNLSSLPLELPPLPKSYVKYKLDFSNNKLLRHLESRPYTL